MSVPSTTLMPPETVQIPTSAPIQNTSNPTDQILNSSTPTLLSSFSTTGYALQTDIRVNSPVSQNRHKGIIYADEEDSMDLDSNEDVSEEDMKQYDDVKVTTERLGSVDTDKILGTITPSASSSNLPISKKTRMNRCGRLSSRCEHGKKREVCLQCYDAGTAGPSSRICHHRSQKHICRKCFDEGLPHATSICQHRRQRSACIDCKNAAENGNSQLKKNPTEKSTTAQPVDLSRNKSQISQADLTALKTAPSRICEHNKRRYYCAECYDNNTGGSLLCEHKVKKYTCLTCFDLGLKTATGICSHRRIRLSCGICKNEEAGKKVIMPDQKQMDAPHLQNLSSGILKIDNTKSTHSPHYQPPDAQSELNFSPKSMDSHQLQSNAALMIDHLKQNSSNSASTNKIINSPTNIPVENLQLLSQFLESMTAKIKENRMNTASSSLSSSKTESDSGATSRVSSPLLSASKIKALATLSSPLLASSKIKALADTLSKSLNKPSETNVFTSFSDMSASLQSKKTDRDIKLIERHIHTTANMTEEERIMWQYLKSCERTLISETLTDAMYMEVCCEVNGFMKVEEIRKGLTGRVVGLMDHILRLLFSFSQRSEHCLHKFLDTIQNGFIVHSNVMSTAMRRRLRVLCEDIAAHFQEMDN